PRVHPEREAGQDPEDGRDPDDQVVEQRGERTASRPRDGQLQRDVVEPVDDGLGPSVVVVQAPLEAEIVGKCTVDAAWSHPYPLGAPGRAAVVGGPGLLTRPGTSVEQAGGV